MTNATDLVESIREELNGLDIPGDIAKDEAVSGVIYSMLATHDAIGAMDCDHNSDRSQAAARNIAIVGRAVDAAHRGRNPHRQGQPVTAEDIATAAASELVTAISAPVLYGLRVADLYNIDCVDCDADIADGMSEIYR